MKVLIGIVLIASVALAGCVTPAMQRGNSKLKAAQIEVNEGRMKRSELWTMLYNEARALNGIEAKGAIMKASNDLIDASLAYESGKITMAEYDSRVRNAEAYITSAKEGNARAARVSGNNTYNYSAPKNCVSRRIGWSVVTNCN